MEEAIRKANTLIEALPYIQRYSGKPLVIKFGGAAMESPEILSDVLEDVVFLATVGMRPIVVHGGGPQISRAMEEAGLSPKFVRGHRVTGEQALKVVVRVLADEITAELVRLLRHHGGRARSGFGGAHSLLQAEKKVLIDEEGERLDPGFVGEVTRVDAETMLQMAAGGDVVVVPPIAQDETGQLYNVNADTAAGAVAGAVDAEKIVFLSNVHGIMAQAEDPDSFLSTVDEQEVQALIAEGVISGGMLPKVSACLSALDAGVRKAHIIDGRLPHSLLLEIFTDKGVGTQILKRAAEA
ncbi:MAG: acetylglutamate kinase [Candidatus Brocadiaceae bacterium]|jgi:acetylglutamate kinase